MTETLRLKHPSGPLEGDCRRPVEGGSGRQGLYGQPESMVDTDDAGSDHYACLFVSPLSPLNCECGPLCKRVSDIHGRSELAPRSTACSRSSAG